MRLALHIRRRSAPRCPAPLAAQQAVTATDELDRLTAILEQTAVDDSSTDLDALTQAAASF